MVARASETLSLALGGVLLAWLSQTRTIIVLTEDAPSNPIEQLPAVLRGLLVTYLAPADRLSLSRTDRRIGTFVFNLIIQDPRSVLSDYACLGSKKVVTALLALPNRAHDLGKALRLAALNDHAAVVALFLQAPQIAQIRLNFYQCFLKAFLNAAREDCVKVTALFLAIFSDTELADAVVAAVNCQKKGVKALRVLGDDPHIDRISSETLKSARNIARTQGKAEERAYLAELLVGRSMDDLGRTIWMIAKTFF